jgi:apolipoprotein N-acyltransferase
MRRAVFGAAALAFALSIGAFLMALSLGSARYSWLGWVTLVPLFLAIRSLSPVQAGFAGAYWGALFYFTAGLLPTTQVPHDFKALALLTLIPAVFAYAATAVTRRKGFHPLLLGLGWAGVELALKPLALRYGLLAGTQSQGWVLTVVGNVGGYLLVAFLIAWINAWVLTVMSAVRLPWPRTRVIRVSPDRPKWLPLAEPFIASSRYLIPSQARAPPALS